MKLFNLIGTLMFVSFLTMSCGSGGGGGGGYVSSGSTTGSTASTTGSTASTTGSTASTTGSTASTTGSSAGSSAGSTSSDSVISREGFDAFVANSTDFQVPQGALLDNSSFADPNSSFSNSVTDPTKDVDLQQNELSEQAEQAKATSLANQFQMDYSAALQLTQLADRVQTLNAQGQMTSEDRVAITTQALGVAGVSPDDVNQATAQAIRDGNPDAINALLVKAATNLGMPSASGLRDQILPALGITF